MNTITNNQFGSVSQANEGYTAGIGWRLVKRLLGFGPPPRLILPPRIPPRIPRGSPYRVIKPMVEPWLPPTTSN